MPIESPSGTLDIENAKLRVSQFSATTGVGIGTENTQNYPLYIYKATEPELILQEGSVAAAKFTSNNGSLFIQSGATLSDNSDGDIVFSDMGVNTRHVTVKGATGNVGIGTASPACKLDISGEDVMIRGSTPSINFSEGTNGMDGAFRIRYDGANQNDNNNFLAVQTGSNFGVSALHMTYGGNVGIGTTSPGGKLDIYTGSTSVVGLSLDRYSSGNYRTDIYQNSYGPDFRVGYDTYGPESILYLKRLSDGSKEVEINGKVGFGTASPASRMHHKQASDQSYLSATLGSYQNGAIFERAGTNDRWTLAHDNVGSMCFFYNTARKGYLLTSGTDSRVNFTGQHRTFIKDVPFMEAGDLEGLIVSADQNKYIKMSGGVEAGSNAITTNESLPVVSLSTKVNDKKCFGVISASEDPEKRQEVHGNFVSEQEKELGDTRVYINSVGEGAMWVVNTAGPLESGDYITTSNVAGYGQKQDSDSLKNYTVAKITMDCDFAPATQPIQQIIKELVNVNYWVKTTVSNVSVEEYSNLAVDMRTSTTETYYSNEDGEIGVTEYSNLESNVQSTYTELTRTVYQKISKEELKTETEGYDIEIREELVNVLDEHGQLQWEDHPTETEKAYKIRYLDASGQQTDEANCVHIAAFVGVTYHCG